MLLSRGPRATAGTAGDKSTTISTFCTSEWVFSLKKQTQQHHANIESYLGDSSILGSNLRISAMRNAVPYMKFRHFLDFDHLKIGIKH
jgi:hypothetical protein